MRYARCATEIGWAFLFGRKVELRYNLIEIVQHDVDHIDRLHSLIARPKVEVSS